MERTFQIIHFPTLNHKYGEYHGKTPKQAAYKAFHHMIRVLHLKKEITNDERQYLVFSLIEPNTRKLYQFAGTRIQLVHPKNVTINGKNIQVHYKTIITSAKHVVPEQVLQQNRV